MHYNSNAAANVNFPGQVLQCRALDFPSLLSTNLLYLSWVLVFAVEVWVILGSSVLYGCGLKLVIVVPNTLKMCLFAIDFVLLL